VVRWQQITLRRRPHAETLRELLRIRRPHCHWAGAYRVCGQVKPPLAGLAAGGTRAPAIERLAARCSSSMPPANALIKTTLAPRYAHCSLSLTKGDAMKLSTICHKCGRITDADYPADQHIFDTADTNRTNTRAHRQDSLSRMR